MELVAFHQQYDRVELFSCFDPITDEPITPPASSTNKSCTDSANGGEWRLVTSQRTDTNGAYTFDGLRDGYYNVKVDNTTLPATFTTNSAEADPAGNGSGSWFQCVDGLRRSAELLQHQIG